MRLRLLSALGAAALSAGIPTFAQIAAGTSDEPNEPVRVYTNEDLDRLAPIPTPAAEPPTPEEVARRWAFVESVLDQAYERIDADRRHELDRRLSEAEADALDRIDSRPRYVLPYDYRYGPVYDHGWRGGPGPGAGPHREPSGAWERPNAELFRPIVPIHARPYRNSLPARPF